MPKGEALSAADDSKADDLGRCSLAGPGLHELAATQVRIARRTRCSRGHNGLALLDYKGTDQFEEGHLKAVLGQLQPRTRGQSRDRGARNSRGQLVDESADSHEELPG